MPASVVCDDEQVADFAESLGASVIWTPGEGLSGAVSTGVAALHENGASLVIVAHADLPRVKSFDAVTAPEAVTIVPDSRRQGTNVIAVPAAAGFVFSYGQGSFHRHLKEARRLRLEAVILEEPSMAIDIDNPSDLQLLHK
jgi:2-phospho-L-lactate guanylyltransferase